MCDDIHQTMTGTLVAEGDSWFDYYNRGDSLDPPGGDHTEVPEIRPYTGILNILWEFGYTISSAAHRGHTLNSMANNRMQIDGVEMALPEKRPKAILLSAGGNDLFDENDSGVTLLQTLLKENRFELDDHETETNLNLFNAYFEKLIGKIAGIIRRKYGKDAQIPIFVHGYAYPVPDGTPFVVFPFQLGPWLKPAFTAVGYHDQNQNTEILEKLVNQFNEMVSRLQYFRPVIDGVELYNTPVRYINLRDCLRNSEEEYKEYWDNELHPTQKGFCNIARKFSEEIERYYSDVGSV